MSSMRNAVARRPHKERSQPSTRSKWGILEKHKDYTLRAQDYNLKKRKLAQLSQKARERNPDEFAFGMLSEDKARQGKHGQGAGQEARLGVEAVKLLKTQDAGYLRVVQGRGRRELERVEEQVGMGAVMNGEDDMKRVVFIDDMQEQLPRLPGGRGQRIDGGVLKELYRVNGAQVQDGRGVDTNQQCDVTATEEVGTSTSTSRKALEKRQRAAFDLRAARKQRRRIAEARTNKLEALKKRQKEVMAVAEQLELQRAKIARSIGGTNKDGVKFKIRERRR